MYLKRLEIIGFKSFADKIKLDFMPGITAVVGPNGSGKSNISDALRWVLGEQSIKNLRGTKMDDVIFAGSDLRKPLSLAEVTIVLDNSDKSIAIDFTEVSVTRKLFRSGESEYLINKSPVRLRDIHELFYDTGIGKEAYSVIGQGKIDSILSARAEERRMIFEEAAGIIKYKSRKQIAERKLEETDRSLLRLKDILNELEVQLGPLKTQSALAEEFLRLKGRLTQLDINYYGRLTNELQCKIDELTLSKTELEEKFQDFEGQESIMDSDIEQLRLELLKKEDEINKLNEDYYRIQNQIEKFQEQIHFLRSKLADISQQEQEYIRNTLSNQNRKDAILKEHSQIEQSFTSIQGKFAEDQIKLNTEIMALTEHTQYLATIEMKDQRLKDEVIELLNEIASLKNKCNSVTLQKEFIAKQIAECQKKLTLVTEQKNLSENEAITKADQLTAIETEITRVHQVQADYAHQIIEFENKQTVIETKNREWRELIRVSESKISMLEEMERSYQGYFQGVKALMAEASGESFHKGIHGIVADLIRVQPGMELALETAFGSSLQNIVIEDDQHAQEAITYLKKNAKGRATFLPLNLVQSSESTKMANVHALLQQHSCHSALTLLHFDPIYRSVLQYLIGQTIVAPDLKTAVRISAKLDKSFRIVTPEGDLVNPGGSITGGSNDKRRLGLLTRKREIEDLKKEKTDAQIFLEKGLQNVVKIKDELRKVTIELENAKKHEQDFKLSKATTERELYILIQNAERLGREYESYLAQQNDLNIENEGYSAGTEELTQSLDVKEQYLQKVQAELTELTHTLGEAKAQKELLQQQISELKSNISAAQQEQNGKLALKEQLHRQIAEVDAFLEELLQKQEQLKEETHKNQETIVESEVKVQLERQRLDQQLEKINFAKSEREQSQTKIKELENKQRGFRRKNSDFQNQLHRLELASNQTLLQMENIQQNMNEDYGSEWIVKVDPLWDEPTDAHQQIERLKNELKELGPVNISAIDDFCQVEERHAFLTTQSQDLIRARESLQKVITEIERTIVKRFTDSLEQVRNHFKRIYSELFEGGNADLFLIDNTHPLDSGIEIIAQPPGKKLQSLSLLSGGERAMTAIALLFAILAVKPSPFCVLDEIDATLDEVNVHRFSTLLELFSKQLQFTVVTHRRGTMEVANTLYGVTMEEMGVSKLISLELDKKAG